MARALFWLAVVLLLPAAYAQGERAAALIQYVEGASPAPPADLGAQLPATRVDASLLADRAPEGRPESALAHFRELQRLLLLRARTGAPLGLTLAARIEGDELHAQVAHDRAGVEGTSLHLVLVEDGAAVPLPGGEDGARFLARDRAGPSSVEGTFRATFRLDPAWERERLGVVGYATRGDEAVQSVVWRSGQEGPSIQTSKLVLVEHATAAWCAPCAPSDDSFALLASQQGGDGAASRSGYARAPDLLVLAGLAVGALAAFALARRRPS